MAILRSSNGAEYLEVTQATYDQGSSRPGKTTMWLHVDDVDILYILFKKNHPLRLNLSGWFLCGGAFSNGVASVLFVMSVVSSVRAFSRK